MAGRGGFIRELPISCSDNATCIATMRTATLTFSPTIDFHSLVQGKKKFGLQIFYLRTYHNAGAVTVFVCGRQVARLDSLWKHYTSHKYSTCEVQSVWLDPSTCYDRAFTNGSAASTYLHNQKPVIELRHSAAESPCSQHHKNCTTAEAARHKAADRQKFKLVSLHICEAKEV